MLCLGKTVRAPSLLSGLTLAFASAAMSPSPRRRVRANLISYFLLALVVGLLNAMLQLPSRLTVFTESEEEEEEPGATFGADALRFQLLKLRDAYGRIPANAYGRAKSQVDLLKWGGAARRVEQAAPLPIAAAMFSASAPASAAGRSPITPQSWRWLGPGNVGGRVRSIVIHPLKPDTIFAGSVGGGIWKTTNGGAGWSPVDDFMPVLSVSSLVINPANPDVMFAGTGEGYGNADSLRGAGIFKSTDGGKTWSQLPQTASQFSAVMRLAISPDGAVILAGTNTGIWRSTDATTFTRITSGLTPQDIDINPAYGRRAIAAGYGMAAYSWDGGLTWTRSAGLPYTSGRIELAFARSQSDTIYALVDHDGGTLYRSSDGGATFRAASAYPLLDNNQGWYDEALWVNPRDSRHIVVGGVYLRQSVDGGATWQWISDGIHVDHHVIVEDPRYDDAGNRTVFFGNDGGVYKTTDIRGAAERGYTSLNHNLGVTQFYGAAGHAESGTIIGGTQDNGTLFNQPPQATRWEQTLPGDGGFVASDPTDASYFYAGLVYLQIQRSDDGGRGWAAITDGLGDVFQNANFIAPFVLDPADPSRMFAGGTRLWRSTNVKSIAPTWTPITAGAGANYISAIAVAPGQPQVMWIGHNMGQVYRSTNATASAPRFSAVKVPTAGNFVSRIAISPVDANVAYVATGSFGPRNILRTVNGGATWSDATGAGTTALPDAPVNDLEIDPADPSTVYAGTEVGVFISRDGGATWELPQDGPANASVDELFWMGTTLVAATHGRGMFAADSSGAAPAKVESTPAELNFAATAVLARSAPRRISIANRGGLPLTIYSLAIDAPGDGTYSIASSSCAGTLAPGASCQVDVVFAPRAAGARNGSIHLVTNAANSEAWVPLHGVAVAPPAMGPLPSPWTSEDVGDTGVRGSAGVTAGSIVVKGGGADIWDVADAFQFVHQPFAGDGTIVARVAALQNVHAWTKAGIMIRDGVAAGAANVALIVAAGKGVSFQYRKASGALAANIRSAGAAPRWLKLTRKGNVFKASTSTDGVAWTKAGHITVSLPESIEVGLVVSSHNRSTIAAATFDKVSAAFAATGSLPAGWRSVDIGQVGKAGRASAAGGTFSIAGAGSDIWGIADAFRFAYVELANDGAVVARVATVQNVNAWTKAGVMIRQNLEANSPHASLFVTPGKGIAFQRRAAAGSASTSSAVAGAAPRFVKLVRAGRTITASVSADGVSWTNAGQQTLTISGPVLAGLAATSHDNTTLAAATFDRATVSVAATLPPGWQSADVGEGGPAGSASAAAGVFTVHGAGADIWGTADAFHFVRRTQHGDGEIVARVASIDATHRWAKAGVMIRQDEGAGAPFAMMVVTPASGVAFQYRKTRGGEAGNVSGRVAVAPHWVKIARRGTTITGYQSGDGMTWEPVGAVDLALGGSAETGLVVTSHDPDVLCTAVFDRITPLFQR
jgi:regulation of enolase protein 1 (concanavalin A-like superfamily)